MVDINQWTAMLKIKDFEMILFLSIFIFMWLTYLWDAYLDYRQKKILDMYTKPTTETSLIMSAENFYKSRLYNLETKEFSTYRKLYHMLETSVILCFNVLPWLWKNTISLVTDSKNVTMYQELNGSMVFLLIVSLYSFVTGMPWKIYSTFVIEERHGFNKQTPGFFIKDQLKSFLLNIVLLLPIAYCLLFIIKIGGPYFYIYAWAFAFIIMIFLMFIYPEFIAPLFDKYTPLPEGELKSSIESLAQKIEFPLTKVYIVEGSKRSSHSNAYFYGFWKNKRIVLFDTLLENYNSGTNEKQIDSDVQETNVKKGCSNEEIIAVLGHELGHWKLNHVLQQLVVAQLNIFFLFFIFGLLFNWDVLFRAFGFFDNVPTLLRLLLVVGYLFSPYHFVLEFCMSVISRKKEFEADEFSVKLGYHQKLMDALIKLHNDNLTFPIYDNLYSMFNHSHPPILERIEAIKNCEKNKKIA